MQHLIKKKKTCPFCYRLWGDVMVKDMMMLMRLMLLEGHLAEQTDTKNPIRTGSQTHSCSALLKVWLPVRSAWFIDANSSRWPAPWSLLANPKQSGTDNQVLLMILCILWSSIHHFHHSSMYNLRLPMCITSFTSLYLAPFYLHTITFSH